MSDSRSRFEAWRVANVKYIEPADFWPWMEAAWQAAEQETARRCAEIADKLAMEYRAKYKGMTVDSVRQIGTYHPHDDGMSDGAAVVEDAIRTEFSEAFK